MQFCCFYDIWASNLKTNLAFNSSSKSFFSAGPWAITLMLNKHPGSKIIHPYFQVFSYTMVFNYKFQVIPGNISDGQKFKCGIGSNSDLFNKL